MGVLAVWGWEARMGGACSGHHCFGGHEGGVVEGGVKGRERWRGWGWPGLGGGGYLEGCSVRL